MIAQMSLSRRQDNLSSVYGAILLVALVLLVLVLVLPTLPIEPEVQSGTLHLFPAQDGQPRQLGVVLDSDVPVYVGYNHQLSYAYGRMTLRSDDETIQLYAGESAEIDRFVDGVLVETLKVEHLSSGRLQISYVEEE